MTPDSTSPPTALSRAEAAKPSRRSFLRSLAAVALWPAACRNEIAEGFDVCVVGSGPAGAAVACRTAQHGRRTLLVESGAGFTRLVQEGAKDFSLSDRRLVYPLAVARFEGRGGTSNLWSGACSRMQPQDFEPTNPYAPKDCPWPIRYAELEPYYEQAERELSVATGQSGPQARLRQVLAAGRLKTVVLPLALAPDGSVLRISRSHLPRFASLESGRLLEGRRAVRIVLDGSGRVASLEVADREGARKRIHADAYVLACGGVETPRLLQLSSSPAAPHGIGNEHDHVGAFFTEHLVVRLGDAVLPGRPFEAPAELISLQFYDEFKDAGLGAVFLEAVAEPPATLALSAVVELRPRRENRVVLDPVRLDTLGRPQARVEVDLADEDRRTLRRLDELAAELMNGFGRVQRPTELRLTWIHHHLGTCRMGVDPRTSVVDPHLRVHGVPNLYLAGSAPFVTGGVGSPTLFLTALSLRLADRLAGVAPPPRSGNDTFELGFS